MSKKQLVALFFCSLVPWTIGNGLLPLLPVYAAQFGASSIVIGYYLAFAYLALTLGTLLAGWLSDRFQRRKTILIVVGVIMIPSVWLMGRATNIWQLTVLSAVVWFLGGIQIALVNILAGLFAEQAKRGAVFGFIGLTPGLGMLIGGLTSGPIVDRWGYPVMFVTFAIFSTFLPIMGILSEDRVIENDQQGGNLPKRGKVKLESAVFLLVTAVFVSQIAAFIGQMGRSISMKELGFASTAISSTAAISGLVMLPFPLLLGWISDKIGRKNLIVMCYVARCLALTVLAFSVSLWHFWIFASLLSLGSISLSIGTAFVTDLVPKTSLGTGISLFRAASWAGGIVGFAGAGYLIQRLGTTSAFVIGALLPVVAPIGGKGRYRICQAVSIIVGGAAGRARISSKTSRPLLSGRLMSRSTTSGSTLSSTSSPSAAVRADTRV
jgi:MFS family permease